MNHSPAYLLGRGCLYILIFLIGTPLNEHPFVYDFILNCVEQRWFLSARVLRYLGLVTPLYKGLQNTTALGYKSLTSFLSDLSIYINSSWGNKCKKSYGGRMRRSYSLIPSMTGSPLFLTCVPSRELDVLRQRVTDIRFSNPQIYSGISFYWACQTHRDGKLHFLNCVPRVTSSELQSWSHIPKTPGNNLH